MEEGSLVAIVKIKGMPGRDSMGEEYEKNVLHNPGSQGGGSGPPFAQAFPPLSNDCFIRNLLTSGDSLSTR